MLTRENFTGPWAGLPVAWTADNRFDEDTYRQDVAGCCQAGVPGVYTGGTTGEFYAMEFDEFKAVARATVEECRRHSKPAMIGCTSTYTLGAARRAPARPSCGADAIQVALPFWMEMPADGRSCPSSRKSPRAAPGLAAVGLRNAPGQGRADARPAPRDQGRRAQLPDGQGEREHRRLHARGLPRAVADRQRVRGREPVRVAGPLRGARELQLGRLLGAAVHRWGSGRRSSAATGRPWTRTAPKLDLLFAFLFEQWGERGLTDTGYDRLGGVAGGFLKTT